MFFGIGSVPVFLVGLPIVVGLVFLIKSDPEKYLKHYIVRHYEKQMEKKQPKKSGPDGWNGFQWLLYVGGIFLFFYTLTIFLCNTLGA